MALNVVCRLQRLNAAGIEQYGYSEWDSQKWQLVQVEDGYYKIVNKNSGRVLDISGLSTASGAACIQYAYNGGWNQMWSLEETTDGYYKIINRNSADGSGNVGEAPPWKADCAYSCRMPRNDNQKWLIQVVQ